MGLHGTSQQVPEARPPRIPVPTVPRSAETTRDIPTSPRGWTLSNPSPDSPKKCWDCKGHPNKSQRLDPLKCQSRQSQKVWDYMGHPNKSLRLDPLKSQSRQSQQVLGLQGTSQQVPEVRPPRIPVPTVPRNAGTARDISTSPRG